MSCALIGQWTTQLRNCSCVCVCVLLQAVRHQAAAVVAALALSSPPLLARLFGECLEGVETFCQQLMLLAAPYTKPRPSIGASSSGGSSGAAPGGAQCMHATFAVACFGAVICDFFASKPCRGEIMH